MNSDNETLTEKDKVKVIKGSISKQFLDPTETAAHAISSINDRLPIHDAVFGIEGITGLDITTIKKELARQNEDLASGDMGRIESMLLDQAHTLQAMFMHFLQRMPNADFMSQTEMLTRLALKSQNQCRQTLATLGELKNPKRATFIKQQNNAVNQQINQEEISNKLEKESNELLEVIPSERLDTRTEEAAIGTNQELETVGAIDRPEN